MGIACFLPRDHGIAQMASSSHCAGIFQENFMDPLYRCREKEAALPVPIAVTSIFQNNIWTASKDECRLWMKGTHGEERKQRIWAFQTHISPPLHSKNRQRPALQSRNYEETPAENLGTHEPSWPSDPATILSPWALFFCMWKNDFSPDQALKKWRIILDLCLA